MDNAGDGLRTTPNTPLIFVVRRTLLKFMLHTAKYKSTQIETLTAVQDQSLSPAGSSRSSRFTDLLCARYRFSRFTDPVCANFVHRYLDGLDVGSSCHQISAALLKGSVLPPFELEPSQSIARLGSLCTRSHTRCANGSSVLDDSHSS